MGPIRATECTEGGEGTEIEEPVPERPGDASVRVTAVGSGHPPEMLGKGISALPCCPLWLSSALAMAPLGAPLPLLWDLGSDGRRRSAKLAGPMAILSNPLEIGDLPAFGVTFLVFLAVVAGARRFVLGLPERGGYRGQLVLFFLVALGLLALLIMMPLQDPVRGQVFQLVGLVLSAAVALSSTTFLGNLIAGGMLRTIRHFQLGDWIRVDGHFGRVTERGLLHTEIQTEDRDLTTLPNLLLATQPVKVVRSSGTIISARVSIGYDIPHVRVEESLLRAAAKIELDDAFVAVTELGDYSIGYRVAGKLSEVDRLISRRSKLRRAMLDSLHRDGIEIMSPSFMNVQQRSQREQLIPEEVVGAREAETAPEEVAFDKADLAKGLDLKRQAIVELEAGVAALKGRLGGLEGAERMELEGERDRMKSEADRLVAELAADEETLKDQKA